MNSLKKFVLMAVIAFPVHLANAQFTFNTTTGGSWGTATNWTPNGVPSGIDVSVAFVTPTVNSTVTLDGARTIGSLSITNNSAFTYLISNGAAGSLIFDVTSGNASILVDGTGTAVSTISASVTLMDTLSFTINNTAPTSASGALTMTGAMSGAGGVIKDGLGTLTFSTAAKTYTGSTVVNQGVLRFTATGSPTATSAVTVNTGAQLRLDSAAGAFSFGGGTAVVTLNGDGPAAAGALLNANTGAVTLANNVSLASNSTISTTNAAGSLQLNGNVSGPGQLTKIGAGTLILNGAANNYAGGTVINLGGVTVLKDGGLGSGNVSLTASGVTLTLQTGVTNSYIADNASISIISGATVNLNYIGTDVVGAIVLNGVAQTMFGTYGSAASGAMFQSAGFLGTGTLTLIPEPATYMLFGMGLLVCAQQFRRRRAAANK